MTVPCAYPSQDDYRPGTEPPEAYDEWRDPSGQCNHDHCIEGDYFRRLYARSPHMTPEEREELMADTELIWDEYAGVWRDA